MNRNPKKNSKPVKIEGNQVEVKNNNINEALKKFKKKVNEDGVLQQYKEKQEYTKPTEKRSQEKSASRARLLKRLEKEKTAEQRKKARSKNS